MVCARVRDDQQAWLLELLCNLVRERARRVAAGNGLRAGVVCEFEDGALCVGARRDCDHVSRVLDRHDDAGRQLDLLPCLADVKNVDTVCTPPPDVVLHLVVRVLRAQVRLRSDEHLERINALLGSAHLGRCGCTSGKMAGRGDIGSEASV